MDEPRLQSNSTSNEAPFAPGGEDLTVEYPPIQPGRNQVEALYQQSLLHFQNGAWQEAIAGFEEVLRVHQDHATARAFLEEARLKAALDEDQPQPRRFRFQGPIRILLYILLAASAVLLLLAGGQWAYARYIEPLQITQQVQARKEQQVQQAFKYLADRDYAAAEQSFRTLLAEDPENVQLQQGLQESQEKMTLAASYVQAEAALAAQEWGEAARLLRTIVAQDPGYADAQARLAHAVEQQNLSTGLEEAEKAYQAGDWQRAVATYEALRNVNADYQKELVTAHLFESYLQQGIHLVRSTKGSAEAVREARVLYEKALTLRPQQAQVMQEIALADKYLEGQTQLMDGNLEAAQATLEWVYQQRPDYADGNADLLLRISKGEATFPTPAAAPVATAVPGAPVPGPTSSVTWKSAFDRQYNTAIQDGDTALRVRDYARAETAYVLATVAAIYSGFDSAERLFESYVKLGTVYAKRGYYELAVSAFETAIAAMARSATGISATAYQQYSAQGNEYAQSGDYENAFAQYDRAIRVLAQACQCGLQNWSVVP